MRCRISTLPDRSRRQQKDPLNFRLQDRGEYIYLSPHIFRLLGQIVLSLKNINVDTRGFRSFRTGNSHTQIDTSSSWHTDLHASVCLH